MQYLTLPEVAARLAEGGRKPSIPTVWRWARKGCRGVHLEYSKFGREIRVTPEALEKFGRELAAADKPLDAAPAAPKPRPRTAARRERDIADARERLRQEGVLR